jgi:hypothetical protein
MSYVYREQSYKNVERKAKSEKKIHYRPKVAVL